MPTPPVVVPPQQQPDLMMFPLPAVNEFPPRLRTADALGEVEAADGHRYYVKGDANGVAICASEWLCTKIGEEVGIAGPPPALIQMLDGRQVFGSRRISGVADQAVTAAFLTSPAQPNIQPPVAGLRRLLSNIYAFDLFVNNVDRHFGNYLSIDDAGVRRLYAMDYSRALFSRWPLSGFPAPHENTRRAGARIRGFHGFDEVAAFALLDQLGHLATAVVESFINRMPPAWITPQLRADFLAWWNDGGRTQRLIDLRAGIGNGQLL